MGKIKSKNIKERIKKQKERLEGQKRKTKQKKIKNKKPNNERKKRLEGKMGKEKLNYALINNEIKKAAKRN